jgi:hypothetical protein
VRNIELSADAADLTDEVEAGFWTKHNGLGKIDAKVAGL